MDGYRETPISFLEWLAGWAVIVELCILFWLALYMLSTPLAG
jgi:hypothetical protein